MVAAHSSTGQPDQYGLPHEAATDNPTAKEMDMSSIEAKGKTTTDRALRAAFAGLVALGLTAGTGEVLAQKADNEKCAGVAKAGKNDCGTSKSSCAGTAKMDRDAEAWILVPKGTCEKIAGGRIQTSEHAKPGGKKS
jgi:uncharacterized membrane protein